MSPEEFPTQIGKIRPSQMMHAYGVGAIVDLPHLSVLIEGLNRWNSKDCASIQEPRLLAIVRQYLHHIQELKAAPREANDGGRKGPKLGHQLPGIPTATFPEWLVCPACRLLAPVTAGFFGFHRDAAHPDRNYYFHSTCGKTPKAPPAVPARFMVACPAGHLDDFPWADYAHRGQSGCPARTLYLKQVGVAGEVADTWVVCGTCESKRPLTEAVGQGKNNSLPPCTGRHPHLSPHPGSGCGNPVMSVVLGSSNLWFPVTVRVLALPECDQTPEPLVTTHWDVLGSLDSLADLCTLLRILPQLQELQAFAPEEVLACIRSRRGEATLAPVDHSDLLAPEWALLTRPERAPSGPDFQLRPVETPPDYAGLIDRVVLVERLRSVEALLGFTRLAGPGELGSDLGETRERLAPMAPRWVPWTVAQELRGEGIFIQFNEEAVRQWVRGRAEWDYECARVEAQSALPKSRPDSVAPSRLVLIHSFSHALMRELALDSGYSAAGLTERIYARNPDEEGGPMAGVLIYTSVPDAEGTLGGLVQMGETATLGRHISSALAELELCTSDPLCAEHTPDAGSVGLNGAACHACLFAPETSCDHRNHYLDRTALVHTLRGRGRPFFPGP